MTKDLQPEVQKIIREYYKQLHANKLDKLEVMYKFLEIYNLLRLNHEEIDNLNRPITNTEIESVIKKTNKQKSRITGEFCQGFFKKLVTNLLKPFQKH